MKAFAYLWVAVSAMILSCPMAAMASTLRFSVDGGAYTECADGDLCDLNGALGAVTLIPALPFFSVNVTTGLTQPVLTAPALMDLNSVNVFSGDPGTHVLSIELSQTDFAFSGSLNGNWGGTLSAVPGSIISFSAFVDETNALFGRGNQIGMTQTAGDGAFSGALTGFAPNATPYSLTQVVEISFAGGNAGTVSFDFALDIPEPTSIALLAIGLGAFGFSRRSVRL